MALCGLAARYAAHLLGDAVTFAGIPLLSPFSSERFSFSEMETGSATEFVLACVLLVFVCTGGWALLPEQVKHTHRQLYEVIASHST